MGLLAKLVGERTEGGGVAIDAAAGIATILSGDNAAKALFDISYPFKSVPQHPESNYYVVLFGHANWPQARTLTLRVDENAVGMIFSLEVLCTGFAGDSELTETRRATMEQYAAIAFSKMCKGEVRGQQLVPEIQSIRSPLNIFAFYHPDTVVAILTIDKFFPMEVRQNQNSESFNEYFISYLPSFYRQGLFPSPRMNAGESTTVPARYRHFEGAVSGANDRNMSLKPFSMQLRNDPRAFLLALFQEIDPNEDNPFFRFFLYYQVYELWMQEIYVDSIGAFTNALVSINSDNATIFRDKIQLLNNAINEKNRLNLILSANPSGECGPLVIDACNEVLAQCGQLPITALHDALYSVRNRLVHSFSQTKIARPAFEKLADATLDLICRTAIHYQPPPIIKF